MHGHQCRTNNSVDDQRQHSQHQSRSVIIVLDLPSDWLLHLRSCHDWQRVYYYIPGQNTSHILLVLHSVCSLMQGRDVSLFQMARRLQCT